MQRDLFDVPANGRALGHNDASILERYRLSLRLDQALLGLIIVGVCFVLTFCFGVERGKNLLSGKPGRLEMATVQPIQPSEVVAARPVNIQQEKARDKISQVQTEVVLQDEKPSPKAVEEDRPEPPVAPVREGYTIQLSTFKTQKRADKHIEQLGTKGLDGFVIPSGSFRQVCVNAFKDRKEAHNAMKSLKAQGIAPADAYVRMIPS